MNRSTRLTIKTLATAGLVALFALDAGNAWAVTLTVTTTADTFDGVCDGDCSLRDAISISNNGDLITLPAGTFTLSRTGPETENFDLGTVAVFDLDIENSVTIQGQGPDQTIIDATGLGDRIFDINLGIPMANVTFRDMKITGGTGSGGSGIRCRDRFSSITVLNCDISGNPGGSGISAVCNTTVTDSTISGNGGGIFLTNDDAQFRFLKDLTVRRSTIDNNAGSGVHIFKARNLLIENSTISSNTFDGVFVQSVTATIKSSTIASNGSQGIEQLGFISNGFPVAPNVTVSNTIIANNTGGDLLSSGGGASLPTSGGNNLVSDNSTASTFTQATDLNNTNPMLAALALNAPGATRTHAISASSPAFNAGSTLLATDQRGVVRPQGGVDDIGAFEVVPPDDDMDGFSPPADCNDNDPSINPGAAEVFDGVDNNCDGTVDEGFDDDVDGFLDDALGGNDCDDTNATVHPGAAEVDDGVDNNCDGTIDEGFDGDGDGFTPIGGGDCNDANANVNPGATETDNGIDDDCDGSVDEGFDSDGDGFTPIGGGDCDDANASVNPGATETDNGIDDDCDGNVDEGFDGDGDGFTPIAGGDCDDANASVNPGATEADNGIDDDCDGSIDEGFDGDGDGFTPIGGGDCDDADASVNPGASEADNGIDDNCNGTVDEGFDGDGDSFTPIAGGDCDDTNASINPGATEVDNGVDDNCDGTVDEGFDGDSDGFTPIGGRDCDDANANVNPGIAEADNGIDDNCDGIIDEGFDGDGDGFTPITGGDCDDADPTVNPGASETANGIDDNCDGSIDEGLDTDGVSAATEDGAPNNGDGNSDGTQDSQQANVASLPNVNGDYVTVASPAGTTLANVTSGANPSPADAPAGVSFPAGFTSFEVSSLPAGGAVSVDLIVYLPAGVTIDTYWKFGPEPGDPTPHWYEFLFDGTTGATFSGNVITLHLVDGLRGDDDLTANGVIVDPGAPALAPTTPGTQPPPNPGAQPTPSADCGTGTCGGGMMMMMPLTLLGLGWIGRRRR